MAGHRYDNPYEEDYVNPFSGGHHARPASHSRPVPLPPEPADFYDHGGAIDIPLDPVESKYQELKRKEKELQAKEAELSRREKIFYFIGFGLYCAESVLSIWVIQQVYMYFRGSGKAAERKLEAALAERAGR
ncbi:hypothetical protein CDL15_Pgr000224 [Punica granatum]|uniref:Secretory carrier-associated membrane protein n=1 Tax=Punica granatum TaxID=22663 RepID=A0A218Y2E9_PUNGR|nr:hypothetical protein CDL15_Pgr000224 [Punica granatum]